MKKYGLQLRTLDQHKKLASKPPIRPPSIFGDDDDDDDVRKEISRQASKSRSLQLIDEQQKKALEEDPLAFDYDGVYDKMKMNAAYSRVQDQSKREPKYITSIIETSKKREREHEIIYERKLLKERSKDDHEYEDKEKFVTRAYKKQLAERAKWLEEERLQGIREEKDDVSKKSDLSDFYFGLSKNVAFGAQTAPTKEQSRSATGTVKGSEPSPEHTQILKRDRIKIDEQITRTPPVLDPASLASQEKSEQSSMTFDANKGQFTAGQNTIVPADNKADQAKQSKVASELFKKDDDVLNAARERFLARKKAK